MKFIKTHGIWESGMMGNSFAFYFSAFSHFLWQSCMTFIIGWHIFIKRKLFPSVFTVFKLLHSLSLKYTWGESVPKPLSAKTWKINTCGGEPRWCPEGKQGAGDKSNVSPERVPHSYIPALQQLLASVGMRAKSALGFVHRTPLRSQRLSLPS